MARPDLPCAWHGDGAGFLALDAGALPADERVRGAVPVLQGAMRQLPELTNAAVALDVRLLRLRRRIGAVLATDRAIVAVQVRSETGSFQAADRLAAEDGALDLADFHDGCRGAPIIPVLLVPEAGAVRQQFPLPLAGAAPLMEASRRSLPGLLRQIMTTFPPLPGRSLVWTECAYAPVPGLIEAACLLYARHGVASLRLGAAGPKGLARTMSTIRDAIGQAQAADERLVIFLTGDPGAGKTLCGLDLAFTPGLDSAFLTGNPTLVHVLREALVRDAVHRGGDRRAARRRMEGVIQPLPAFRDHYLSVAGAPSERLLVIDEAQRCWSGAHAVSKTQNRPVKLSDSEPGHLLDIMAGRPGWAVLVCLVGGGQEIHDGEGGLASWGHALAARPSWRALAPEAALHAEDARQRLPRWPGVHTSAGLHLARPIRSVRAPTTASWVNAVLADDPAEAASIARDAGGVPFAVTRSLQHLRVALRQRGTRSSGLLASSGARRLRAEGLGAVLPHQDDDVVARWFLDRWPDIRSADALEVVASEFGVQGLELDRIGLCWDADLVRMGGRWVARRFRANVWTRAGAEARSNRLNAYRVLLTRARHGTTIWVPRGCARDPTRAPALYDAVAAYLIECGAAPLDGGGALADDAAECRERVLL